VVPLAVTTIARGLKTQLSQSHVERHRRLARVTLPIWLFVSVSGVVVYLMLYQM
jgi:uncharacterized membrane protein YozB (DUF420 family)